MSFKQCNCKSTYSATGEYFRCNKHKQIREHFATNELVLGDINASSGQSVNITQQLPTTNETTRLMATQQTGVMATQQTGVMATQQTGVMATQQTYQQFKPLQPAIDNLKSHTSEQAALIIRQYADFFNQISKYLYGLATNSKLAQKQLQSLANILDDIQKYMIKINDALTPLLGTNLQQTIQDISVNLQSILNDIAAL